MNSLRIKPLTLALLTIFVGAQHSAYADTEARLHEKSSVTPGRSISAADEQVVSSSAARVIHHINLARDELHAKNSDGAKQQLAQAETLLDIIQNTVPTQIVKSQVWTADNKLKYENTEEQPLDQVPIYVSLAEQMDFKSGMLPSAAKQPARQAAKSESKPAAKPEQQAQADQPKSAPPAAADETVARDAGLHYSEVDMPLKATRRLVEDAQAALEQKALDKADDSLVLALAGIGSVSAYVPQPLVAAQANLKQAQVNYQAGDAVQAKVEMERAIRQLAEARRLADPESRADVKQMLDETQALSARMEKKEPGVAEGLNAIWSRAEVLAERNLAYTSFGWGRNRIQDPVRNALIEAKRCVGFADIDANLSGEAVKARQDLEQAKLWIDKAAQASSPQGGQPDQTRFEALRTSLDNLIVGQGKGDQAGIHRLKQQLNQAIDQV